MESTRPKPATHPRASPSLTRRYAAWSLDAALVAAVVLPVTCSLWQPHLLAAESALLALLEPALQAMFDAMPALPAPGALLVNPEVSNAVAGFSAALGNVLLWTLAPFAIMFCTYGATFEHLRGATPGKRALGLRVTDAGGQPLPRLRHALRQASGTLSWLTLNLGHLLAMLPPDHQALHDRIARARVVADHQARLPRWARTWLWLQAVASCAAVVALAFMLSGAVDAALLRML